MRTFGLCVDAVRVRLVRVGPRLQHAASRGERLKVVTCPWRQREKVCEHTVPIDRAITRLIQWRSHGSEVTEGRP